MHQKHDRQCSAQLAHAPLFPLPVSLPARSTSPVTQSITQSWNGTFLGFSVFSTTTVLVLAFFAGLGAGTCPKPNACDELQSAHCIHNQMYVVVVVGGCSQAGTIIQQIISAIIGAVPSNVPATGQLRELYPPFLQLLGVHSPPPVPPPFSSPFRCLYFAFSLS